MMEKRNENDHQKQIKPGYVKMSKNKNELKILSECESNIPFSDELEKHIDTIISSFDFTNGGKFAAPSETENIPETTSSLPFSPEIVGKTATDELESSMREAQHKTPHSTKKSIIKKQKSEENVKVLSTTRKTPSVLLSWPHSEEIWQNMVYKEEATLSHRDSNLFKNQENLSPRMRAILLDWIMEVCEVYRLRRVTYYLTVDYVDRYLTIRPDLPKNQLQLVGITALFIASKLEEVYPPKLSEFAYVCDGACTSEEILDCEILILCSLGWDVNPTTASGWLNLYMQIHYKPDDIIKQSLREGINHDFMFPQYSGYEFVRASLLMDLFTLDTEFLKYSYSIIAAAAMYFMFDKQVALEVSGLTWDHLKDCVEYMAVFNKIIEESPDPRLKSIVSFNGNDKYDISVASLIKYIPKIIKSENYSLQTHCIDMDYLEKATLLRLELENIQEETDELSKKSTSSPDKKDSEKEKLENDILIAKDDEVHEKNAKYFQENPQVDVSTKEKRKL